MAPLDTLTFDNERLYNLAWSTATNTTVLGVARYILARRPLMNAMKLQKLCYYAQAWSLVWDDKPLFDEPIEAWANGPVCPDLYQRHRGRFDVDATLLAGEQGELGRDAKETVDAVLGYYGDKSPGWLSKLVHTEAPWADARDGMAPGERGNRRIENCAMAEYYGALVGG